jgi:hypothetical protein
MMAEDDWRVGSIRLLFGPASESSPTKANATATADRTAPRRCDIDGAVTTGTVGGHVCWWRSGDEDTARRREAVGLARPAAAGIG